MPTFQGGILWSGWVRIEINTVRGKKVMSLPNLITDAGLNLIRQALADATFDAEIKFVALGTSNTEPVPEDTKLGNEVFRKAVTKQEYPATGQVQTTCYIAPYEGNYAIQEIGWFAGAGATTTKDSGVLVARVLYARTKSELESWQITRTDAFGRV